VLFHEQTLDPVRKTDIFVVRTSGGDAAPVVEGPLEQSQAVFSPDGRAIAYVSNESGVSEVFAQPFSPPGIGAPRTGGRVLVSTSGGAAPHWRRDGKELLYLAPDGALMAAACVTADAPRCSTPHSLFKVPGVQSGWGVSPDGARFLFAVSSGTSEPEPFSVILNWIATLPASRP
jgi:Tol biopolymer transport system component